MKRWNAWILVAMAVCMVLSLCACNSVEPPESTPSTGTNPTTAPTETTVPPTEPPLDPAALYSTAVAALSEKTNLIIEFTSNESRTIDGETYTEDRSGTAFYKDRNSDAPEALITETFTCGSYSTQYIESYLNGSSWCRVNNCNFRCEITLEEFLAQQLPAVLLDASLYDSVTAQRAENGAILYFESACALESWIGSAEGAELVSASGKLVLDAAGNITSGSYQAEYTYLSISYTLNAAVEVTAPEELDLAQLQPVYPEGSAVINDLQIPRHLLRAVGNVYTSRNMSASYRDTMYSQLFGIIRTQNTTVDTWGSDDSFMAALNTQIDLTENPGGTTVNTNDILFRDGIHTSSLNGGDPTVGAYTAQQIRILCEDTILSGLLPIGYIAGANLDDTGDFLHIALTGSEQFADSICNSIYTMLQLTVSLDEFAESYSTDTITAYLTIDKYTGLPTAMGFCIGRTHTYNGVSYQLSYQMDQTLKLGSTDAYENITGESAAEE